MVKKVPLVICLGILLAPALIQSTVLAKTATPAFAAGLAVQGRSSIYGIVFGDDHRPAPDIYVELLNDVNSTVGQAKTDLSGRFSFSNLPDGRYMVKVRPMTSDYFEQTVPVMISAVSSVTARADVGSRSGGSSSEHLDIVLRRNERANAGPFALAPGVVFVQEVPAAAKKQYEAGIAFLRDKKEKEGLESLRQALETYPDYYQALDRLGGEYSKRGAQDRSFLEAGFLLLTKAVQINPRGFSSLFGLGWTQYELGLNAEAMESLKRAIAVYEKASDAHLWLGKALRRAKNFAQAEVEYKRANELNSGKAPDVHWQLAALYSDQRRYKEAADELELYLKGAPKGEDQEKIKGLIKQLRDKAK